MRDAEQSSWAQWGTPYLREEPRVQAPGAAYRPVQPCEAPAQPLSGEALRRALLAEEQRQVFAILNRLRRARQP
ncbi:hypothetical protein GCM10008937_02600 [Deinococcus depolymerans]|uniref:Transcriptional regulator n=1 Tax=Deinococcus depolymerans TaxID=392408 RepID=A0ABP3LHJ7_9DEIO